MSLVSCKCGKSQKNFMNLKQSDFGSEGWENECCLDTPPAEKAPEEPKKPRKKRENKEE